MCIRTEEVEDVYSNKDGRCVFEQRDGRCAFEQRDGRCVLEHRENKDVETLSQKKLLPEFTATPKNQYQ